MADETDLAQRAAEELRAAATLMADAQRVANFGSWEWLLPQDTVTWSEQLFHIFGLEPGTFQASYDAYLERVHLEDRAMVAAAIREAIAERHPFAFEHRIVRPDGGERTVRCSGEPLLSDRGDVARVVGVCQDVTDQILNERARVEADLRFRSAFAHSPIGIALIHFDDGADPRLIEVNRALCEIAERREGELVGARLSALWHPDDADTDLVLRERLLAGELGQYTVEKRIVGHDGSVRWLDVGVSLVPDESVPHGSGIVQVQDVTERKRSEDQLRYLADHDSLTGLLSRRRFREELETQLALKRRYGGEGALLLLDVDRLKAINDTHGHAVGDSVLRRVAETLGSRVRSTDSVGRLAGDEFAVLLPSATAAEADALAESLLARFTEQRVGGWTLSVSIGISLFGEGHDDLDTDAILAGADAAMYEAKEGGGAGSRRSEARLELVSDRPPAESPEAERGEQRDGLTALREALERDELLVYAQPVIDLRGGGVAHRELLVRMRDENDAVLPASAFLGAAAREPGLCARLDRWVVGRALAHLTNGGRGRRFQVNLSGETLGSEESVARLLADVRDAEIQAGTLAFEIGEGSLQHDAELVEAAVEELAASGVPLVLDGFSAGFGSFEYLQRLPLEQIKIDGSVIHRLDAEGADDSTLRAIVRLATGTRRTTVAKLVDSSALVPLLRMHGVDMAQGYHLAEPQPLTSAVA